MSLPFESLLTLQMPWGNLVEAWEGHVFVNDSKFTWRKAIDDGPRDASPDAHHSVNAKRAPPMGGALCCVTRQVKGRGGLGPSF